MQTDTGALDGALEALLAQHKTACDWASDLAQELEAARARMKMLAQAVEATARLLPPDDRTRAEQRLTAQETVPMPGSFETAKERQSPQSCLAKYLILLVGVVGLEPTTR